jgi:hypothetical protein
VSLLSKEAGLSALAKGTGELLARKLFKKRGNHTEVHLSEYELALAIAAGAEVALQTMINKAVQP